MTRRYADDTDVIVLDLRDFWRARRADPSLLDSWSSHGSPLEHFVLATGNCRAADRASERRDCEAAEWLAHLSVCTNCAEQVLRVEVVAFAAELAAWREVAA